jgi:two-component system NtrC family response regulator
LDNGIQAVSKILFMARILIIDDDNLLSCVLVKMVLSLNHQAEAAGSLEAGLRQLAANPYDLVILDVNLPDGSGLEELPKIVKFPSSPLVVILTGAGDPDGAETAIRSGAWDYIQKQSSLDSMRLTVQRALQFREAKQKAEHPGWLKREGIVGNSTAIKAALDIVAQAARTESNVLITGETGTGKECFAHAIHQNSTRARQRFVVVDCTALPETLVESLLFGYEKGSFTGALQPHDGLIRQAHEGTLFLDEVGELPLQIQKTFLRVLEERRFRPLGSNREVESDFRLIAATNRDLDQMVQAGTFREDLLHRLNAISLPLPPLRQRSEDILELSFYYIKKMCEKTLGRIKGFSPEFIEALSGYPWPGNVRGLINALESAYSASAFEPTLIPAHLPLPIRIQLARQSVQGTTYASAPPGTDNTPSKEPPTTTLLPLQESRETHDKNYLKVLLDTAQGNIAEACRISQMSRSYLYRLIQRHGIDKAE